MTPERSGRVVWPERSNHVTSDQFKTAEVRAG